MDGVKSFLASKTIWGAILVMVSTGLRLTGIDIGDSGPWVENITTLVGAALAVYGRVKAVKKIG